MSNLHQNDGVPWPWIKHPSRIMSVDTVTVSIISSDDEPSNKFITVNSTGKVPTTGWTSAHLVPHFPAKPPENGIWNIDFVAVPPSGLAGQIVLPISAEAQLPLFDWVKIIKVHGANNYVAEPLPEEHTETVRI